MSAKYRTLAVAALLGTLLISTPALADKSQRQKQSEAFWREGVTQYDLGKFDEAIKLLERAYQNYTTPAILFNLGQAQRQANRPDRALFYYRAFLRNEPEAKNRDAVESLIKEVKELIEEQKKTVEHPPPGLTAPQGAPEKPLVTTPAATQAQPWYRDTWGWVTAGTGTVALGIGTAYLLSAASARNEILDAANETERERLRRDADSRQRLGLPLTIIGSAALITGAVLLVIQPEPVARQMSVAVAPGQASLILFGRF